ncbi:hypothetical protein K2P56_03130 [Patescibacteria group bacterium]|nr:hypothetical protein [Patescibacteria group bacterium]
MPLKDKKKRKEYHAYYMREVWYPKNKEKHMRLVKSLKLRVRAYLEKYKRSQSCGDCGISGARHPEILDFDHIGLKKFEVGSWAKSALSIKTVQEEIKKCEVVCANCHRIRTEKRRKSQV